MHQTYAVTTTRTNTYTEARARYVMEKVLDDIIGLFSRGLITKERALSWHADLSYIISMKAMDFFEIQLRTPGGSTPGLRYELTDDGQLYEDTDSGGIDFFLLPTGTTAGLFVSLRENSPNAAAVRSQLQANGWGTNGHKLDGTIVRERAYSSDGFGVTRNRVGDW